MSPDNAAAATTAAAAAAAGGIILMLSGDPKGLPAKAPAHQMHNEK